MYLVIAKLFQCRFVQFVEIVSLLCEIGIFIAAMVILAQNRPYEDHFGIIVFLLVLLVLSFVA
jgi:high-affinity Fe2+/Pb2+ permease